MKIGGFGWGTSKVSKYLTIDIILEGFFIKLGPLVRTGFAILEGCRTSLRESLTDIRFIIIKSVIVPILSYIGHGLRVALDR